MITAQQRDTINQILGVFETGSVGGGDPGTVTILPDGAGITYGRHQSTDRSDSLDAIVMEYIDRGGVHAACLEPFLPRLANDETARVNYQAPPQWARDLMAVLKTAGSDPIMQEAQEAIFDRQYWAPCAKYCQKIGVVEPLTWAVLYDTTIQSGLAGIDRVRVMPNFPEVPPARGGDERAWTRGYINARREYLSRFQGKTSEHTHAVRNTVYRPENLQQLADTGNWELRRPIEIIIKSRRWLIQ